MQMAARSHNRFSAALHQGDSAEAIERHLQQRNLAFSYDRFAETYARERGLGHPQ